MNRLSDIVAYEPVHSMLATSGMPKEDQFAMISEYGYEFIISSCSTDDKVSIENEDLLVSQAGMNFIHFPVSIKYPTVAGYEMLRDQLNLLMHRKVWLHCTYNYRVSVMIYLYNVLERGIESTSARVMLEKIWSPSPEWENMIELVREKYVYQYL